MRESFREAVFARDDNLCVVCRNTAVDAHHLIERRLWPDGGYTLDNGVSLCSKCHLKAESTEYSPDFLREKAGITKIIIPDTLESGNIYDKWGNPYVGNKRMRGPLFFDESVQKIIKPFLHEFTTYIKYPRTPYLPWSYDLTRAITINTSCFEGQEVIVTEKMDGENTTMYKDFIHARSLDTGYHVTRTWVKNFHAQIAYEIPEGFRICGENMYGEHSIHYDNLDTYFYGFSIWENDLCLSWEETLEWFQLIGIISVPVIWEGIYNEFTLQRMAETWPIEKSEGYVVRLKNEFKAVDFQKSIAKWIRLDHITSDRHWLINKTKTNNIIRKENHVDQA